MKSDQKKRINGFYNHRTHSQIAYKFFRDKEFAISLTLFHLGVQPS